MKNERKDLQRNRRSLAKKKDGRERCHVLAAMDYYTVLGISRDASIEQVKKAYRRLALQFHPDLHSQAPKAQQDAAASRFREISEAYEVLSDATRRSIYNRDGRAGLRYRDAPPDPRYRPYSASDWSRRRQYAYDRTTRPSSWNFRLSLSPLDVAFHAVLAGILVIGLTYGDIIGKTIWEKKNAGKSFEDFVQEKKKKALQEE